LPQAQSVVEYELYYKKNNMSTDREKGRGNKSARVTRGPRSPKHGKRKHYIVHTPLADQTNETPDEDVEHEVK
jgi:hypothetical protein